MFNTRNNSAPKPSTLIASTVTTAFNEERDNLTELEGEACKMDDIRHVTNIFKFLGAKASVPKL